MILFCRLFLCPLPLPACRNEILSFYLPWIPIRISFFNFVQQQQSCLSSSQDQKRRGFATSSFVILTAVYIACQFSFLRFAAYQPRHCYFPKEQSTPCIFVLHRVEKKHLLVAQYIDHWNQMGLDLSLNTLEYYRIHQFLMWLENTRSWDIYHNIICLVTGFVVLASLFQL